MKKNKKGLIIILALFAIIFIYMIYLNLIVKINPSYTIGVLTNFEGAVNGTRDCNFTYQVDSVEYKGVGILSESDQKELGIQLGDTFEVRYQKDNPSNAQIIFTNKKHK